jgi:perosamine synthetase
MGLRENEAVLIPTMTFAATAEIILYQNAIPVLVDCDPTTGNMDLADAERKIERLKRKRLPYLRGRDLKVVGMIPVHVGGLMMNVREIKDFARRHNLWIIEDAAHSFPAAWRPDSNSRWEFCGDDTAAVTCYSFYANKTITTGEGGMAVTNDEEIADRIRLMSLHGLSQDAWGRFADGGSWDYRIVRSGYKYNLTDIAAAMGRHQLGRAEAMRERREAVANFYIEALSDVDFISLPPTDENRIHSWHLFPIRLKLRKLSIERNEFINELKRHGVGCSVHWRPLHMHPLYRTRLGWHDELFPMATKMWSEIISLPIFSSMTAEEMVHVVETVKRLCFKHAASRVSKAA